MDFVGVHSCEALTIEGSSLVAKYGLSNRSYH